MTAPAKQEIPCVCGQTMTLIARFVGGWGLYRCRACRYEAIETDERPNREQRTGQDAQQPPAGRAGREAG